MDIRIEGLTDCVSKNCAQRNWTRASSYTHVTAKRELQLRARYCCAGASRTQRKPIMVMRVCGRATSRYQVWPKVIAAPTRRRRARLCSLVPKVRLFGRRIGDKPSNQLDRPLVDVARHIERAVGRGRRPYVRAGGAAGPSPPLTTLLPSKSLPHGKSAPVGSARGFFPLGFAGQTFARPFGVSGGLIPVDVMHRELRLAFGKLAPRSNTAARSAPVACAILSHTARWSLPFCRCKTRTVVALMLRAERRWR